jgi:hypothetical protein
LRSVKILSAVSDYYPGDFTINITAISHQITVISNCKARAHAAQLEFRKCGSLRRGTKHIVDGQGFLRRIIAACGRWFSLGLGFGYRTEVGVQRVFSLWGSGRRGFENTRSFRSLSFKTPGLGVRWMICSEQIREPTVRIELSF